MADMKRVEALKERCPLVYCEMEPGKKITTYAKTWNGIQSKHHFKTPLQKSNSVHISSNKGVCTIVLKDRYISNTIESLYFYHRKLQFSERKGVRCLNFSALFASFL